MAVTASEVVLTCGVTGGRRMSGQRKCAGETCLQKTFNTIEMFQDQLVASVQLDTRFSVDAFCVELRTKPALWPCAVTSRLPGSTYLALRMSVRCR